MAITRSVTKYVREKQREHELARNDPNKFIFFPQLPIELRKLIWEFSRPESRFIELKVDKDATIYSAARVPNLLHACRESREVALKWYKLSFAAKSLGQARTYFDPTVDGLLLQCYGGTRCACKDIFPWMGKADLGPAKRILLEGAPIACAEWCTSYFPEVEEVTVIEELSKPRVEVNVTYLVENAELLTLSSGMGRLFVEAAWL